MWEQYKKTAVRMQIFIAAVTAVAFFYSGRQWFFAMVVLILMQISAVFGAFWGARLKDSIESARDQLPLDKR